MEFSAESTKVARCGSWRIRVLHTVRQTHAESTLRSLHIFDPSRGASGVHRHGWKHLIAPTQSLYMQELIRDLSASASRCAAVSGHASHGPCA